MKIRTFGSGSSFRSFPKMCIRKKFVFFLFQGNMLRKLIKVLQVRVWNEDFDQYLFIKKKNGTYFTILGGNLDSDLWDKIIADPGGFESGTQFFRYFFTRKDGEKSFKTLCAVQSSSTGRKSAAERYKIWHLQETKFLQFFVSNSNASTWSGSFTLILTFLHILGVIQMNTAKVNEH
jgi:hypothetical protein